MVTPPSKRSLSAVKLPTCRFYSDIYHPPRRQPNSLSIDEMGHQSKPAVYLLTRCQVTQIIRNPGLHVPVIFSLLIWVCDTYVHTSNPTSSVAISPSRAQSVTHLLLLAAFGAVKVEVSRAAQRSPGIIVSGRSEAPESGFGGRCRCRS